MRSVDALVDALAETRNRTLDLVAGLADWALHTSLHPIMSPLVWDLGHIAAYEDLWCVHRLGAERLLRSDLADLYDAFETPRPLRARADLLERAAALEYLAAVRERTLRVLRERGPSEFHQLALRHELQHTETMRQAMFLGGLPGGRPARLPAITAEREWLEVPAGPFFMGAGEEGFAYDNERPRHGVDLPAFRIAGAPATNASWLAFAEGGGYERREWWSDEGWAWKERNRITSPLGWPDRAATQSSAPVMHVSWFEADAFARSSGARLPTEAEWERAVSLDQGASLQGLRAVWEWTASEFAGYPGFVAHPYPEYSAVFFNSGYRVLRGGSWATSSRVATATFRNWDLPQRRQIFAGVRLARDA